MYACCSLCKVPLQILSRSCRPRRHGSDLIQTEAAGAASRSAKEAASEVKKSGTADTLYLGMLFGGWYLFNIWFNMYATPAAAAAT